MWLWGCFKYHQQGEETVKMGLTITVNEFDSFHIGYIEFMKFCLELAQIYLQIKDLKMDYEIEKYCGQEAFNVLERLKSMFYHSWKHRRRVILS